MPNLNPSPTSEITATHVSLRERLKTETRTEHEELEERMAILSPTLTEQRYFEILQRFYQLHLLIEKQLGTNSNALAEDYLRHRTKSAFLEVDLTGRELSPLSTDIDLSWLDDAHTLLGALYVIEGSTLGGQVVSKGLRANHSEIPVRYFSGYQSETGRMWQSFISQLAHVPPDQNDAVVNGARKMFQTFLQVL